MSSILLFPLACLPKRRKERVIRFWPAFSNLTFLTLLFYKIPRISTPGALKLQSSNCSVRWMTHERCSKLNNPGCQYRVCIQTSTCRSGLSIAMREEKLTWLGWVSQHFCCWSLNTWQGGARLHRASPLFSAGQQHAWENWVKRGVWALPVVGTALRI